MREDDSACFSVCDDNIYVKANVLFERGRKSAEFYEDISDPNRPYPGIIGVWEDGNVRCEEGTKFVSLFGYYYIGI